jgi:site-specific DNA-methyltransferase (adenine-specific)/modification methylase
MKMQSFHDGRAVLYLGDCIELLKAGKLAADAVVSDPPYGIAYKHSGGVNRSAVATLPVELLVKLEANRERAPIVGDDRPFDPAPWLAHCHKIALMGADHFSTRLPQGRWLAWDKHLGIGPDANFSDAEFAWVRGGNPRRNMYRHLWSGGLMIDKSKEGMPGGQMSKRAHVSQKPIGLMRHLIQSLKLRPGSVILDPYMGSGSTGCAALQLGHKFVGVEIEERHFNTACDRIERALQTA